MDDDWEKPGWVVASQKGQAEYLSHNVISMSLVRILTYWYSTRSFYTVLARGTWTQKIKNR